MLRVALDDFSAMVIVIAITLSCRCSSCLMTLCCNKKLFWFYNAYNEYHGVVKPE